MCNPPCGVTIIAKLRSTPQPHLLVELAAVLQEGASLAGALPASLAPVAADVVQQQLALRCCCLPAVRLMRDELLRGLQIERVVWEEGVFEVCEQQLALSGGVPARRAMRIRRPALPAGTATALRGRGARPCAQVAGLVQVWVPGLFKVCVCGGVMLVWVLEWG